MSELLNKILGIKKKLGEKITVYADEYDFEISGILAGVRFEEILLSDKTIGKNIILILEDVPIKIGRRFEKKIKYTLDFSMEEFIQRVSVS